MIELETLYTNTKIKVANYINNSNDPHIKFVKSFQIEKEERNLRSIFKDAKRYGEEPYTECHFEDNATVFKIGNQEISVDNKEPRKVKEIIHKTNVNKRKDEVRKQPWLGKFVNHYWNDPELSNNSHDIFKQWKNVPSIILSVDTLVRQQLLNTMTYRAQKLHEKIEELSFRIYLRDQETVSLILCGCSELAQSSYKARHDRMLRSLYHCFRTNMDLKNRSTLLRGTSKLTRSHAKRRSSKDPMVYTVATREMSKRWCKHARYQYT